MEAQARKPQSQMMSSGSATGLVMLRDQFEITTWLLIGAALQAILVLLPIRSLYALAPAFVLLAWRLSQNILMTYGLMENTYMKGVINGKFTAMFPSGPDPASAPADEPICVFLLSTRNNHPMGLLAPGAKLIGDYAQAMHKELEKSAATNGFLGGTTWLSAASRSSRSEILITFYFRSAADVHAFAHSPVHRDGWNWWNREVKKGGLSHLSISHEIYDVPKGKWESVYVNSHPTSLSAISVPVTDEEGKTLWRSPIVDASRGRYKTHKGRMGQTAGADNDGYEDSNPYTSKI